GGGLRDVADLSAVLGRPRRPAEDGNLAAVDDLDADEGAHERRLARAAGAEEPRHGTGPHLERDPREDEAATANDAEPANRDCGRGHADARSSGLVRHVGPPSPLCESSWRGGAG